MLCSLQHAFSGPMTMTPVPSPSLSGRLNPLCHERAVQRTYLPMMAVCLAILLLTPLAGAVTDLHTTVPNAHGLPAAAAALWGETTQANRQAHTDQHVDTWSYGPGKRNVQHCCQQAALSEGASPNNTSNTVSSEAECSCQPH